MNIEHGVFNHSSTEFQLFVTSHHTHSVTLHHDVTLGQQLQSFQGLASWSDQPLSTFDKGLLVANIASDLHDITSHVVSQQLDCLWVGHTPLQQLDQVSSLDDDVGVPHISRRFDGQTAPGQVDLRCHIVLLKVPLQQRKDLFDVLLPILRE